MTRRGSRSGERDEGDPGAGGPVGNLLDSQQPAAAARDHDPQAAVGIAAVGEQRRDLGPERLLVEAEMDRVGGAAQAGDVVVEAVRVVAVELDHLEGAVAAQQPVVEDRDRRLLGGRISPSTLARMAAPMPRR